MYNVFIRTKLSFENINTIIKFFFHIINCNFTFGIIEILDLQWFNFIYWKENKISLETNKMHSINISKKLSMPYQ